VSIATSFPSVLKESEKMGINGGHATGDRPTPALHQVVFKKHTE